MKTYFSSISVIGKETYQNCVIKSYSKILKVGPAVLTTEELLMSFKHVHVNSVPKQMTHVSCGVPGFASSGAA